MQHLCGERTRVVITGLGIVSAAGRSRDTFWESLTTADSECGELSGVADFSGRITDFCDLPDAKRKAIRKSLKLMNRETQIGVAAGQQALADSGVLEHCAPERVGICFGADNVSIMPDDFVNGIEACSSEAGEFDMNRWGEDGIAEVAPLWLLKCLPNMPACHLAIINDLRGPGNTITQRDVAANMALAEAARTLWEGEADAVLCGATGTTLTTFNHIHARLEEELGDAEAVCRPFDLERTGPAPGEGAAAVILEPLAAAESRGARIYGELLGSASASAVGRERVTACRTAAARALRQTLNQAGLSAEEIGHIHAHGLGTRDSDIAEAAAIQDVFGGPAQAPPVVAAKSRLANAAAGSGALELVASVLALEHGHLFPISNYRRPDPECPVRAVCDDRESAGESFVNLNVFGRGLASCVAVRRYCA